jgi:phage protein D
MAKAPAFDFSLGTTTLDELNIRHLIKFVEFEESIGKFDQVTMEIIDGPELANAWELVKHGNVLQLSMGYYNDQILPMCLAFLSKIEPRFESQTVQIVFSGYLRAMSVGEKDRSLSGRTIREVVEEIVADYEPLVVGTIEAGDTTISSTNTQSKQTDLSFLEGIASSFAMQWKIEPTEEAGKWALSLYKLEYDKTKAANQLPIHAYPEKVFIADTKALKLKTFRPQSNIFGVSSSVEIRSNNPDQPVVVSTDSKDPTSEPRVVRGSEVVATVFGEVVRVNFYENVTDEDAAKIIAEQTLQMDELAFVTATQAQMQEGNPELRVGDVRRIVPHGISLFEKVFEGDYMLTGSKHRVDSQTGYDTWINVAMNSLTIPEVPEEAGWGSGGGSGGRPVLIHVYVDGTAEGWYMVVGANNQITRGEHISQSEIENNSYWMGHVNPAISVGRRTTTGFNQIQTSEGADGLQMGPRQVWASGFYQAGYTTVQIDWPDTWQTYSGGATYAVPVRTNPAAQVIVQMSGFLGGEVLGPRVEYVDTPSDGTSVLNESVVGTYQRLAYQEYVNRMRGPQ